MVKLLIGGAGRSGTSLLSKMFSDFGCNVSDDSEYINSHVSAGIEVTPQKCLDFIASSSSGVAKTPFLYEICHAKEFNSDNIDLVVIPVRDPLIATMSRLVNEIQARCFGEGAASLEQSVGLVNAGLVYSFDGQESLRFMSSCLAMLLHQCASKGIRTSLVPFPEISSPLNAWQWSSSIEDVTIKFGISATDICSWLATNFDQKLSSRCYETDWKRDLEKYEEFMVESRSSVSGSAAFVIAHRRYLQKNASEKLRLLSDLERAQIESERFRSEADSALLQLSRAEGELQRLLLQSRRQALKLALLRSQRKTLMQMVRLQRRCFHRFMAMGGRFVVPALRLQNPSSLSLFRFSSPHRF